MMDSMSLSEDVIVLGRHTSKYYPASPLALQYLESAHRYDLGWARKNISTCVDIESDFTCFDSM